MSALTNKTVDLYYIFFIINLKISTLYFIILSVIGLAMFLLAKIAIFSLARLFFFSYYWQKLASICRAHSPTV